MLGSAGPMPTLENVLMSAEPWVAVVDVLGHLRVSHDMAYRWIGGKGLPAHALNRMWNFKRSDVDYWGWADGVVYAGTDFSASER